MVKVLEAFQQRKLVDNSYSEDRTFIGETTIGIIDGARGPLFRDPGLLAGLLGAAANYLSQLDGQTDAQEGVHHLTQLAKTHKDCAGAPAPLSHTGGFVFCVVHTARREVWRLGDCGYAIDGSDRAAQIEAESVGAKQRALILRSQVVKGLSVSDVMTNADYDSLIDTHVDAQMHFANQASDAYGFGVINGAPVPQQFVEVEPIPIGVQEIVVTSDGYPRASATLAGAEALLDRYLREDPLCIGVNMGPKGLGPGRRSYDDRSYIGICL